MLPLVGSSGATTSAVAETSAASSSKRAAGSSPTPQDVPAAKKSRAPSQSELAVVMPPLGTGAEFLKAGRLDDQVPRGRGAGSSVSGRVVSRSRSGVRGGTSTVASRAPSSVRPPPTVAATSAAPTPVTRSAPLPPSDVGHPLFSSQPVVRKKPSVPQGIPQGIMLKPVAEIVSSRRFVHSRR